LQLSVLEDNFPPYLFNFIMIDISNFFIKELGNRDTQQLRSLYQKRGKTNLQVLDKLNQATLSEGKDFNILSTKTIYSDIHDKFVEVPTSLNFINLYSLDSTFTKSICIGEELSDISVVQNEFPQWNRTLTFVNVRAFNNFFGVIHVNESFRNYETIRATLPSIMLFDWDGEPLAELKMENHLTHFDIDFLNQELYTFDVHSDEFFKYGISEVLAKLK